MNTTVFSFEDPSGGASYEMPTATAGAAADPFAAIPRVLHLAAGDEDAEDGDTLPLLTDQSSVGQHLTVSGTLTLDIDGGPGGTPCYVFPTGAYATRLDPTLPQGTAAPGFSVLAVVKLTDLSGYPQILEMGLLDRNGDAGHHNYQHAIAGDGALYVGNSGGDRERGSTAGVVTINTWVLVGWRWTLGGSMSSTNPRYAVNGAAVAAASGTGTGVPALTREALRVGRSLYAPSLEQMLLGRLAELLLIPTDDSGVFDAATAILLEKYGL